jgi:cyclohexyl-isocyanide hydratase
MVKIAMVIFRDFEALDLVGPLSMFGSVPSFTPILVAATREPVEGTYGFTVRPTATFTDRSDYDVIFVPGGRGISNILADDEGLAFLAQAGAVAKYVTSVCTGSLVLGAAGLLQGYKATTHWRYVDLLASVGATATSGRVVHDRNRITGGGVTAGMDFALTVIAEIVGVNAARSVQLQLEYNPAPPFAMPSPYDLNDPLVAAIRERTAQLYRERAQLLRRS